MWTVRSARLWRAWWLGWSVLLAAGWANACERSVRWNPDPPFTQIDARGEVVGIDADIVREALKRMGCTVRWVQLPWARALLELEAGRLDVLPGAFKRPEREEYAWFSDPRPTPRNVLYASREARAKWPLKQIDELPRVGFRLGVQINVAYGHAYDELLKDEAYARSITRQSNRLNLWQMVANGRLDGVIASEDTAAIELAELKLDARILPTRIVVSEEAARFAFGKRAVEESFVRQFNQVMAQMRREGLIQRIQRRYLSPTH
ncbi:substrate-binding periplasmic protein [Piscinibacterium candidicorallinum]|uniref:Substrate-binding periplasmic protein n=1 Tax=Piscinibacterium candidicorallinum TaxID=1793872 RepID=A0ABV7H859_9BURK